MNTTTLTSNPTAAPGPPITAPLTRLRAILAARPGRARTTAAAIATLGDGLRCSTVEGAATTMSDLPPALGGTASAPTPSALLRAALANCLAIGYRLHAAELGVELTALRVIVETDTDVRGMLDDAAGVPAGFTAVRAHVEIDSPAPAALVQRLVDQADDLSPVLDVFRRPQAIERTVSIGQGA